MAKSPEPSAPEPAAGEALPFEAALAKLEQIVGELDGGQLALSDALARYEAGVGHLKRCYQLLDQAERRIEVVTGLDSEGQPITKPFDEESASLEERTTRRGRGKA